MLCLYDTTTVILIYPVVHEVLKTGYTILKWSYLYYSFSLGLVFVSNKYSKKNNKQ